ncbi:MAG TPA: YetF domain-containing protein [Chthonomonadaceae bacterium]|nr:YetF domain-containing protein [Chthonomonadaceae bacterium]
MRSFWMPLLPVALHTAAIYLFLIFALRALNRRTLGQLTVVDLVVVIILGSAVETAMVNANTSLQAGLVSATTLLLINRVLTLLCLRSRRLRHLILAGPVLLIQNGHFIEENLRRAGLTQADVQEALREREQADLKDIRFAVLEMDGTINIVPTKAAGHAG